MAKRQRRTAPPRFGATVRRPTSSRWHLVLTLVLVLLAVGRILYREWENRPLPPPPPLAWTPAPAPPAPDSTDPADARALADALHDQVDQTLADLGLWPELIRKTRGVKLDDRNALGDYIAIRVPADLPLAHVNLILTRLIESRGGRVFKTREYHRPRRVEIHCGLDQALTTRFLLERDRALTRPAGDIAIVLDDFGYTSWNKQLIERFCALPQILTLAILPNEGQVDGLIEVAQRHGHEILVHLPMEPDDYPRHNPGHSAIFVSQPSDTIRHLVRASIEKIPGAIGINNHMGSRATTDPHVMAAVMEEVKRHQLFFLDSFTSPTSIAYSTAQDLGIPSARRDLFIDPIDEIAAIEYNLWQLADLAIRQGHAIGIGHDREYTLLALEAVLPRLEARGFRFVSLSQLVQ